MTPEFDLTIARDFGTALLLGALIGIEREKRNQREGAGIAGLRSFILFAQIGAIGGYLGQALTQPWLLPAVVLAAGAALVAGYHAGLRKRPDHIGLTTELAAFVTVLLGALATTGHREVATGLGVTTAVLLAYKQPLHGLVGRLGWDDALAGLRLLTAAFVVLPLLPVEAVDPWGAIRPYELWLLVLLISGLSLVGYVATRLFGSGHGTALTAATGGLVSSTAVTLALVRQSREPDARPLQLAGGILLAWGVMFGRVLVAAAVVNATLLEPMLVPFASMSLLAFAIAAFWLWRGNGAGAGVDGIPLRNPFSLLAAMRFALLFSVVQLVVAMARAHLPASGLYAISALAGLTDVDAITLAMAEHARADAAATTAAVVAITIAAGTNTLVKLGMGIWLGRGLGRPLAAGTAAVIAAGVVALVLRPV